MLTAAQIRMARAALQWSVRDTAKKTKLGVNTITRIENGAGSYAATLTDLQAAFERAGIVFLPENGGGAGVRFKNRAKK
jgi:transcriptional regulator with XRE-family HTH domain